jgi:NADH:ubiquinone oxidoreductase subunit K
MRLVIKLFFRENSFLVKIIDNVLLLAVLLYLIYISDLSSSISSGKMLFWLISIDRVERKCGLHLSLINISSLISCPSSGKIPL